MTAYQLGDGLSIEDAFAILLLRPGDALFRVCNKLLYKW